MSKPTRQWIEEFPAAITVCDADGTIIEMNHASIRTFAADGGEELIGRNVLDCHPEPSRSTLEGLMQSHEVNAYTIEKGGRRKLIYQAPWYRDGEYAGLVELSLVIPSDMPHFVRSDT